MAWFKRGVAAPAEGLYWIPWSILTIVVVFGVIVYPASKVEASVNPVELDAAIFEERVFQHLAKYSPVTGSTEQLTDNLERSLQFSLSQKRFAYKITVRSKIIYGNQEFYDIAWPLAPVKYLRFMSNRTFVTQSGPVVVAVDQVYPRRYEKFS
ncbi:MAG TPA: hypothetical protein VI612_04125 [Candidatus Nanoarchaeia archaeon]|nr:hypothetical protein [Candidatus Nanoarchaeia archaeon]